MAATSTDEAAIALFARFYAYTANHAASLWVKMGKRTQNRWRSLVGENQ